MSLPFRLNFSNQCPLGNLRQGADRQTNRTLTTTPTIKNFDATTSVTLFYTSAEDLCMKCHFGLTFLKFASVQYFQQFLGTLDHRVCYVTKVDMFCDRNYFYVLLQMCMAKKKPPEKYDVKNHFSPSKVVKSPLIE